MILHSSFKFTSYFLFSVYNAQISLIKVMFTLSQHRQQSCHGPSYYRDMESMGISLKGLGNCRGPLAMTSEISSAFPLCCLFSELFLVLVPGSLLGSNSCMTKFPACTCRFCELAFLLIAYLFSTCFCSLQLCSQTSSSGFTKLQSQQGSHTKLFQAVLASKAHKGRNLEAVIEITTLLSLLASSRPVWVL